MSQSPPPAVSNPDWDGWPPIDAGDVQSRAEARKRIFEAKVAPRSKRIESYIARGQTERDQDVARDAAFAEAMFDVAKGGLERARANAESVQKAAGAIGTLYAAVLGVAFSVSDRPLPTRGVLPAFFLGLAVALSTVYLAYSGLPEGKKRKRKKSPGGTADSNVKAPGLLMPKPRQGLAGRVDEVNYFVLWVRGAINRRAYFLRAAVVALAIGVIYLPAPFIAVRHIVGDPPAPPAEAPPWPTPPAGGEAELREILYTAQVAEVAAQRTAVGVSTEPSDLPVLGVLGIVGVFLMAAFSYPRKSDSPEGPQAADLGNER